MTKNWLDNYNESKVTLPEGFVGMGNNIKGRNYSPAWGGQFQDGGILGKTFLQPTSSKLPKGWNPKEKGYSTEYSTTVGKDGEYYLVPGFKQGKLVSDPEREFHNTGELLGGPFKTIQSAQDFADRRHKYVEQGKPVPSPLKTYDEFAMGGSVPGAVGFTYARTQDPAPSNGPYAKKTLASAENGKEMKFYQEGLDFKPKTISEDGTSISANLKKEAEERLARMNRPKATISQYTPKKGEQAKFDKQKLQRIAEDNAPLNRMAASKGAENMQDAIEAALIMEGGMAAGKLLGKGAKAAGKYLTEETALKNAYKLNPYAFKPNEANWYRQVGESAIDDAFNTGVVREAGEEVSPRLWGEFQDQLVRMQGSGMDAALAGRRPASPFFAKGELFYPMGRKPVVSKTTGKLSKGPAAGGSADHLIETSLSNESFQPAYVKGMGLGVPTSVGETAILKPNPTLRDIENFKFYKQNWLKGYKEVPKPTSTSKKLTNKEIQEYNQKLYLDRRKGLGNQGPTDAPPEGLMPFESPEYKQGGWLNKYK